jgi:hypothetical protein
MEFLRDQPVLVFFLVLSLGYMVGDVGVDPHTDNTLLMERLKPITT